MTSLVFVHDLDSESVTLTPSESGIVFTATGEHEITLPEYGTFSFVCNSTEETTCRITLLTSGNIVGGDSTSSGIVLEGYAVATLTGNNYDYQIMSGYGAISTL